jgi:hypothetical protein
MTKQQFTIGGPPQAHKEGQARLFGYLGGLDASKRWTVTVGSYTADRTLAQNRLQFEFTKQIARQKPDDTAEGWRAYCKLRIGVPILRIENEKFRNTYDRIIRPLDYEQKLELMSPPIDMPITSLMTVKQFALYLDEVQRHFASEGVALTAGDDLMSEALGRKKR